MSIFLLQPRRFTDSRGWFVETFNQRRFAVLVTSITFVQDNQSFSLQAGTVRGMHFQNPPRAQAKLVSCLRGSIFDVVIDIRRSSPTYGKHISTILSAENGNQVFIPAGFAHGLMTLEPDTEVHYKVSDFYSPECEDGLLWNDEQLAIDWPIKTHVVQLSSKDIELKTLKDFVSPFDYDGVPMSLTEI